MIQINLNSKLILAYFMNNQAFIMKICLASTRLKVNVHFNSNRNHQQKTNQTQIESVASQLWLFFPSFCLVCYRVFLKMLRSSKNQSK